MTKNKNDRLTMEEIHKRYPDQWVILLDVESDENNDQPVSGRLVFHSKDREKAYKALDNFKNESVTFFQYRKNTRKYGGSFQLAIIHFNPREPSIITNCRIESEVNPAKYFETRMAVDTGASLTLVSPKVLQFLDYKVLSVKKHKKIVCADGVVAVPIMGISRIWLGKEKVENIEVICHTLPPESNVDGLLGLNVLKQFNCMFYFDRGILEIQRIPKR